MIITQAINNIIIRINDDLSPYYYTYVKFYNKSLKYWSERAEEYSIEIKVCLRIVTTPF